MDLRVAFVCLLLVGLSLQQNCDQCDCNVSSEDPRAVQNKILTCLEGTITWYNPIGGLRLVINPKKLNYFETCFIIETGKAKLTISREVESNVNSKSPAQRSNFVMKNDNNLQPLLVVQGTSKEYCISSEEPVRLYLEPETTESLGYQKVTFKYDSTPMTAMKSSIEECRPCNEDEILRAYCSSEFVFVGSMDSVEHFEDVGKTKINVAVNQIIRQKDAQNSHFTRKHRDSPTLEGSIYAPRKCGIIKGDGLFLLTGRLRLGELHMGCAPYLDDWVTLSTRAHLEGRMDCTLD